MTKRIAASKERISAFHERRKERTPPATDPLTQHQLPENNDDIRIISTKNALDKLELNENNADDADKSAITIDEENTEVELEAPVVALTKAQRKRKGRIERTAKLKEEEQFLDSLLDKAAEKAQWQRNKIQLLSWLDRHNFPIELVRPDIDVILYHMKMKSEFQESDRTKEQTYDDLVEHSYVEYMMTLPRFLLRAPFGVYTVHSLSLACRDRQALLEWILPMIHPSESEVLEMDRLVSQVARCSCLSDDSRHIVIHQWREKNDLAVSHPDYDEKRTSAITDLKSTWQTLYNEWYLEEAMQPSLTEPARYRFQVVAKLPQIQALLMGTLVLLITIRIGDWPNKLFKEIFKLSGNSIYELVDAV